MRSFRLLVAVALLTAACGKNTEEQASVPTAQTPPDTSLAYEGDDTVRPSLRDGKDYPGDRVSIDERIQGLLDGVDTDQEPAPAFAIVTPHAALTYSGAVAAEAYARVKVPDTVIVMASGHHQEGESPALWADGLFILPGHAMEIRTDLVERLGELVEGEEVTNDRAAFMEVMNHPLENQLPFISTLNPNAKLVPFTVADHNGLHFLDWDVERVERWGKALADLVRELEDAGEEVLVIATTDLVHRISLEEAEPKNDKLMQQIVDLDVAGLHDYVTADRITICGEIPVAITMAAAKELGYTDAERTGLDTSYTKLQNPDSVVGYGSAILWPRSK